MGISAAVAGGLGALGIGAETAAAAAPIILGVGGGAALGAGEAALTGGKPLKGALAGGITGGFIPAGGELLGGSLGTIGAEAVGGLAGGALGSAVTGGNPLIGGVEGGVAGGLTGLLSGTPTTGTAGGGSSAGAGALPGGAPSGSLPVDLTADPTAVGFSGGETNAFPGVTNSNGLTLSANPANDLTFGGPQTPVASAAANLTPAAGAGAPDAPGGLQGVLQSLGIGPETSKSVADILNGTPAAGGKEATGGIGKYLIPAAGVGLNAIESGRQTSAEKSLADAANTANAQGSLLKSYLLNGTLPPGAQAALTQATKAAKANIISRYAQRGQSTDPTQNGALGQELAAVDTNAAATTFQLADQLFAQGVQGSQLSSQLYQSIIGNQRAENQDLSNAIAEFAAAASGGTRVGAKGVNITIPGASTG